MQKNSEDNVVCLEHLTFCRGPRKIFNDVSFNFKRGKVTAILGPSGTGKTTLLHLIGGLLLPDRGSLSVLGHEVPMLSKKRLFALRKRMGMLFQSGALFTDLTVFDNVAFPIRQHTDLPESLIRDIVLMKLEAVGLRGAKSLMPAELSGGMLRRVALARAIALDPEIMLYDEPFTGQDPISMGVLVKLIRTLNDSLGLTSIIVSHDVQEVLSIADYVYIISGGKMIGHGTPEEIVNDGDERIDQFVHGRPDGPVPFHYPAKPLRKDFIER
ncbi:MAG: putative transporter ATP-binding protein [Gammaproteobacteria bacterium]|nr:putative transporter ATP-binding protein [Gammaproteobacteria bacterium]